MDINTLLDEVKAKLGVKTDYRLAKTLEISSDDIYAYRAGKQIPDDYACFRFAEVLGKAPTVLIAQIQAEKAKHEHKRLYFKRFFSIVALWITFGAGLVIYNGFSSTAYAAGNNAETRMDTDINAHYAKSIMHFLTRLKRQIVEVFFRYFTCNWPVKYSN